MPPFSVGRRAVRPDIRTVDGYRADDPGRPGQRLKYLIQDTLSASPVEPVVDRRIRAVFRWTIPPPRPSAACEQYR